LDGKAAAIALARRGLRWIAVAFHNSSPPTTQPLRESKVNRS
jgi:hypothetical protein